MEYLYGAAVQGIQQFIFKTNTLAEITGASELVERICTVYFEEKLGECKGERILNAAGNIKYIFSRKSDCQRFVRVFPKFIQQKVPGVQVSQAVVEYDSTCQTFTDAVMKLEELLREQRNKPMRPLDLGLVAVEHSRQAGLPTSCVMGDNVHADASTQAKINVRNATKHKLCEKTFGFDIPAKEFAYNINDMTGMNSWIAIIHADGNGLGKVVQEIGSAKERFSQFSKDLDNASKMAAQKAIKQVQEKFALDGFNSFRPIVLSGDDFTIICQGAVAMDLTRIFLEEFENQTKKMGHPLTACAGITFIKASFPFYYGYRLAEELCSHAKNDSLREASCIQFHKVEDSFVDSYEDIQKRVLRTKGDSLCFGPYYIHERSGRWTVEKLLTVASMLKEDKQSNAVKAHIRQWVGMLFEDTAKATQHLKRLKTISSDKGKLIEELTKSVGGKIPAYDVLSLNAIMHLKTK